jgi:hypothetical protein
MRRRFHYLLLLMITSAPLLHSQYYFYNDKYYNSAILFEAGLSIGAMNCLTDLGGKKGEGKPFLKDFDLKTTHPCGSIYFSILYDQTLAFRLEGSIGKVSASDNVLKHDQSEARKRYDRNLHFQSNILELVFLTEFFPQSLFTRENYPLLSSYLMAGIGFFKFGPKAKLNGQWMDLHSLHTEGQEFKEYELRQHYKLTQINFPVGLGARYEISALVNVRAEVLYRFLKTDYLDDVSTQYIDPKLFTSNLNGRDATNARLLADRSWEIEPGMIKRAGEIRGNPQNKDGYFSFNIKAGLVLNRKPR